MDFEEIKRFAIENKKGLIVGIVLGLILRGFLR